MINERLYDEEFLIKSLRIILDTERIKNVKYHNSIFKVSNLMDRIYDYDSTNEVMDLINNVKEMSGKKHKKGIYKIETKSDNIFFLDVSKDAIEIGKSIRIKNRVKFLTAMLILIALNYICII